MLRFPRWYATHLCFVTLAAACSPRPGQQATAGDSTSASAQPPPAATPATPVDSAVSWTRLAQVLQDETSQVLAVRLSAGQGVSVRMRDGRTYRSTEPQKGKVEGILHQVDASGTIMISRD